MISIGILNWLRKKLDAPSRGQKLHDARVNFYSSIPSSYEVNFKHKVRTINDIGSSDDFNPKSFLWKKEKKKRR